MKRENGRKERKSTKKKKKTKEVKLKPAGGGERQETSRPQAAVGQWAVDSQSRIERSLNAICARVLQRSHGTGIADDCG